MKRDIEKQFFKAFQPGGVVHACIDVIQQRYDLHYLSDNKPLADEWKKYYNETIPSKITELTETFDDTVIRYLNSPLIDEISDNLNECKTIQDKERYLYTLIVPFNELSELLHPELSTKRHIDHEQQYKRLEMISKRFKQILNEPKDEVEKSLSVFRKLSYTFANRLDALCLQNGIDLLRLQKECGTYIKTRRTITDVDIYVGSLELTQHYIDALGTQETQTEQAIGEPQQIALPKELDNNKAKCYFDKAIKAGFMNENYMLLGSKYQKALFAEIASEKLNIKHKWKIFETLWGVKNLAQTRRESKERFGKVDKENEIEEIFN